MLSMFSKITTSLVVASCFVGTAVQAKTINFGIISTESSQNSKERWTPFLEDMEKKTGYEIKAFFAPDYAGIIQGMRFDKVDIAWFGNKSAMEAVDRANGEVIASTSAADGAAGYWSLLITHKDSPINNVEDMLANAKDLNFGNGDPNSTSGFLVPGYYVFAQNNVDPSKIFKRTVNANHEVNALSVANKQVDVATSNTENMVRLERNHPEKASEIKEIWRSPLIPSDPIVIRTTLEQADQDKLKNFILGYGDTEEEMKNLNHLDWGKFKAATNDHLLPIRQLEAFKQRSEVEASERLSAEDKAAQLKTLDQELAELDARMKEIEANS